MCIRYFHCYVCWASGHQEKLRQSMLFNVFQQTKSSEENYRLVNSITFTFHPQHCQIDSKNACVKIRHFEIYVELENEDWIESGGRASRAASANL